MFVHRALCDALRTKNFKTTTSQLVRKTKNTELLNDEFQVINHSFTSTTCSIAG